MTKDMTTGSPMKLILGFSVPLLLGNLFQQFYSMVDSMIVGRFLGTEALAAVGSTGSLNFMILGFCMGLCGGFCIPVAQRFGAKDYSELKKFVGNSIVLSVFFSAVMAVLTVLFCRNMLEAMHTPENIIDGAYNYIVIIFAGIPVIFFYNILAGFIRSLGDSKTPVIFLIVASMINIVLDFVLIVWVNMGVSGAAVATVLSQLISGICCLVFIVKKFPMLHITKEDLKPQSGHINRLCSMGVPMGLQFSITAIGSVILQTAVNSLGSAAVAAVTAASKLQMLFACAFDSMGATMSTYGGQNVGAREYDRIDKGLKSCIILGVIYSAAALLVLVFFGRYMLYLFIDPSETQIIQNAYQFIVIVACFFVPLAGVNIFRLLIQGVGFSKIAIVAGIFEMVARAITGFILVPIFGFTAACFASPIAWVMADMFLVSLYPRVMKKLRAM